MPSYIYILASKKNGSTYIGVTTNLVRRVWEHKTKAIKGHTAKYGIDKLVYYEVYDDTVTAIERENRMKQWNRGWKNKLIYEMNPEWDDLYENIAV